MLRVLLTGSFFFLFTFGLCILDLTSDEAIGIKIANYFTKGHGINCKISLYEINCQFISSNGVLTIVKRIRLDFSTRVNVFFPFLLSFHATFMFYYPFLKQTFFFFFFQFSVCVHTKLQTTKEKKVEKHRILIIHTICRSNEWIFEF